MLYRGAMIHFTSTFKDSDGDDMSPSTAVVNIRYRADSDGTFETELLDLTDIGEGKWRADWDSAVARPGAVDWSVRATDGIETIVKDGQFVLAANPANPALPDSP